MSLLHQLYAYEQRMREQGKKPVTTDAESTPTDDGMPFMYASQNVRWVVNLRSDGSVHDVQVRSNGKGKGKDLGLPMAAPNLVRSGSGAKPRLLMDNAEYVLGLTKKEGPAGIERARRFYEAYVELVQRCATETKEPRVQAVATFLSRHDPETFRATHLAPYPDFAPDTNVTFEVEGINPVDLPSVREFWARQFAQGSDEDSGSFLAECLITGSVGPVMAREPVKIKGILGGQTSGMNFISANAQAFESYGLQASHIAPVKFEVAEAYANGLNRLLADPDTSLKLGGVTYAFWTEEGAVPLVGRSLKEPPSGLSGRYGAAKKRDKQARTEEVRQTLWGLFTGRQPTLKAGAAFYAAGFTPSGSRIAVRTHLSSTVQEAVNHLADYFESQSLEMVNPAGSKFADRETFDLYALVGAMYRDPSKAYIAPDVDALVGFALSAQPLPASFLVRLAARNRADTNRVTRPRAVLTKMVLLSRKEYGMQDDHLEALDPARPEPAYHLGRLLAVLDDIQSSVMKANTTLVDRFYGSMSTTPYAVVGRLVQGSQAHLQKLRKDNEGAYFAKQRELEGVMTRLRDIPAKPLTTPQQALFALGYYHQRAEISAGIRERSQAKKARDAAAKVGISETAQPESIEGVN